MKKRGRLSLVLPLVTTFVLILLVVIYTARLFYRISVSNIYEVGDDKISAISASLENYLDTAKSVLWVTADTIDHMIKNGDSNSEILDYIMAETTNQKEQFDENYTGLYGYIRGEYLDGLGWEPPAGYEPTQRDWYIYAKEAGGSLVIVPPYLDAQTGSMVISVCKLLSDGVDSVSVDVINNHIQSIITDSTNIKGKGYGFIVDSDGTIIAHGNKSLNGQDYNTFSGGSAFLGKLHEVGNGYFETDIDGKTCVVFTASIMDQWQVVLVVDREELFAEVFTQQAINICVFAVVFILLVLFYYIAYRKEQKNSRENEELKIREHQKAYEAELLRVEKSAADSANQAKGRFLAQMSHEIRTPMNAVLGMNEMILRESNEENIIEYSENIQVAGRTLLSLINSILDFSKIEDGKMEIISVRYFTMRLVENVVNSVSERAKNKGLELIVDIDKDLACELIGDDVRVGQVIVNLLTNAVKYTNQGRVTLSVKKRASEADDVVISVNVSDTGIGIREEDMQKLFESFTRLDEIHNRNIEGTGLGMAIVTRLLSLMGSELKVKSEYGKGSEFSFDIRQGVADAAPVGQQPEKHLDPVETARDAKKQFVNARVLVTDDNEMNRKVSKNLLKLFGIVPELASSGEETIGMMKEKHFDMVLLDHMMPGMDGVETLMALKAQGLVGDTVMVALTANAVIGARETYLDAGFKEYLSKPISLDALEEILAKYLPESSGERDGSASVDGEIMEFEPVGGEEVTEFYPEEEAHSTGASFIDRLKEAGLNTEAAMGYFANDEGFYREMMGDYADSAPQRIEELDRALSANDLHDYEIRVHALKSASKTVGLDDVYELALELEMAAKKGSAEVIDRDHDRLKELVKAKVEVIKNAMR